MKRSYIIEGTRVAADAAGFQAALAAAYLANARPLCLCVEPGVPMYIASLTNKYVIKRMPNTGSRHHPDCDSFEPPLELSGLGEVSGSAIVEDATSGATLLRLAFSLSKCPGRGGPVGIGREGDTAKTCGTRLTLRSLLHYLWEEASLHRWTPAMEGKRKWYVVRKALLEAACAKTAKGYALGERLFVPEMFSTEHKLDIERRRVESLATLYASTTKRRELMLLIGEVKAINPARYGFRIVIKHLPDCSFMLDEQLGRRMEKRFADEVTLWNADESTHLVMIATFGIGAAGALAVEEMALMLTSVNWIPVEDLYDLRLITGLTQEGRRFMRGMRYNLASDRPLAAAVVTDTRPCPVAMYIVRPGDAQTAELKRVIEASALPSWVWQVGATAHPALPALHDYRTPASMTAADGLPSGQSHCLGESCS